MQVIRRLGLVALIMCVWVGGDQIVKGVAKTSLAASPPISLLNDSIHIEYTENPGAILGLGGDLPREVRLWSFAVFVSVVLVATLVFAFNVHSTNLKQLSALACVAAGGVGNLIDRLFNDGSVIDFLRLGIGPLQTGIFNVADVAIMGGALAFLLLSAGGRSRAKDVF